MSEEQHPLAFGAMVTALTTGPVLRHSDHERQVIITSDVSDYMSAGVLSQYDDNGVLHRATYYSKNQSPAECNYDIMDKELIAIIKAAEDWRLGCEGAAYPIKLITDHKNLEYLMTKKLLNRRQAGWSEFSTCFHFCIADRPANLKGWRIH